MFITPQEVMAVTPYEDVTLEQVRQAQFIIELYVGRTESEVDAPRDKSLLARATAAQCVYMRDNPDIVFNQVRAGMISQGGQMTQFDTKGDAPFIAPLAEIACRMLSWKNSRSIKVGAIRQDGGLSPRERWVRD